MQVEQIVQILRQAKLTSPVVGKLLAGTIGRQDFPELAELLDEHGAGDVASLVRELASGASHEAILTRLCMRADLLPILSELGGLAGEGADLVRAVKDVLSRV